MRFRTDRREEVFLFALKVRETHPAFDLIIQPPLLACAGEVIE